MDVRVLTSVKVGKKLKSKLKKNLRELQNKRLKGTPDRFKEEDVLQLMERNRAVTEQFWNENEGYIWVG